MRSRDGEVFQRSRFTCNCEFPAFFFSLSKNHVNLFLCGCSSCTSTTAGWLLEKKKYLKTRHDKKKNLKWWGYEAKYSSCKNPWLNVDWLIDICSEGFFCLQEEKKMIPNIILVQPRLLFVWNNLSVMNYFRRHSIRFKGEITSLHPETVIIHCSESAARLLWLHWSRRAGN